MCTQNKKGVQEFFLLTIYVLSTYNGKNECDNEIQYSLLFLNKALPRLKNYCWLSSKVYIRKDVHC